MTVSLCFLDIRTNQTFWTLAIKNWNYFKKPAINSRYFTSACVQILARVAACRDLQGWRKFLLSASYYSSHVSRFRWLRSTQVWYSRCLLKPGEKERREGGGNLIILKRTPVGLWSNRAEISKAISWVIFTFSTTRASAFRNIARHEQMQTARRTEYWHSAYQLRNSHYVDNKEQ